MGTRQLTPELVLVGAVQGWFPMSVPTGLGREDVHWFAPDPRTNLPICGFRVSRSLGRRLRRGEYEIRFDTAYEAVMRACIRPSDNWISEEFVETYTEFFRLGFGHCAEVWFEGELVGGVYGFAVGGFFSAESMFHRRTDASKVALWALMERCRELGMELFDVQYQTSHLASLGAVEISRAEYERTLGRAVRRRPVWSPALPAEFLALALPG